MDPIYRIILYLFNKKNVIVNDKSFKSFFDDGIYFPKLVAISFNIDCIPGINLNPKNKSQKSINNDKALNYLSQNNQDIGKEHLNINSEQDQAKLLKLILTKQCFKIDEQEILDKSNAIVKKLGIRFYKKTELLNFHSVLLILNVLTNSTYETDADLEKIDIIAKKSFEKAKVPLVIDKTSFDKQRRFTVLIQIKIIFDCFSEKIGQILLKEDIDKNDKNENSLIDFDFDFSDSSENSEEDKNDSKSNKIDKFEETALLTAINAIGQSKNLHFTDFNQAINKNNPHKFIKILFNNDDIETIPSGINDIIKYLGTKDPIFNIKLFDFKNPKYITSSAISFYKLLLNRFFIKRTKKELIERCLTIILSLVQKDDFFMK